ncbi:MAG TPA: transposase [Ktedonobacteraceae bacterium]|jgi:IS605 OrfB family transposase|nr:transposase [Ktedonobacteraceae bacterium]
MAKASKTMQQTMQYPPQYAAWFTATQTLFNTVASFYFDVITAHDQVLLLSSQKALNALETLTHATEENPNPVMPLGAIASSIPAMFRRAAIHAALGSARSFSTSLRKWRVRKEKAEAKKKRFTERPPVPPRTWNRSTTFYAGLWKQRSTHAIMLKLWTGTCWSWVKVHLLSRDLPDGYEPGSPSLVRHGKQWRLHTPVEKQFTSPTKAVEQLTSTETRICAIDLNLDHHLAVCTIQDAKGSILATTFISGGKRVNGFRKTQLGRIARNRRKTGILAEGQQDNAALWAKIRQVDEQVSHLVSTRIVQFARQHRASILVFEHLGNLKPQKGKYGRRSNAKRAYWMKGRIFNYAKYKAYHEGIITCRVSPRNTSKECARCHGLIARYDAHHTPEGYTPGTPLASCPHCGMKGNADRNASLVIGQRLLARSHPSHSQEKPPTPLLQATERNEKSSGVTRSQDANSTDGPSTHRVRRRGIGQGHGTAHEDRAGMVAHARSIPTQLRLFNE